MNEKLIKLAETLSIHEQLDFKLSNFNNISPDPIYIRPKRTNINIDKGTSGWYIYDKNNGHLYDISAYGQKNRLVGEPQSVIMRYKQANANMMNILSRRGVDIRGLRPNVVVEGKRLSPQTNIPVGSVYHSLWGYSMQLNEFVEVVKQTPKTVTVIKLETRTYGNQRGTEEPIPNTQVGKPFVLRKTNMNHPKGLKGSDRSEGDSDNVLLWKPWDGQPKTYDTLD